MLDICENFSAFFKPGQEMSVDEGMIAFKGRLSFRQYIPSKPIRYGIKFYAACDSVTGFCLRVVVYSGREVRFVSGEGFTFNVVCYLLIRYN